MKNVFIFLLMIAGLCVYVNKINKNTVHFDDSSRFAVQNNKMVLPLKVKSATGTALQSSGDIESADVARDGAESANDTSGFEQYEKQTDGLTLQQLKAEVSKLETRLNCFSELDFEKFSLIQRNEFSDLNRKKAVFLKKYIFKKYSTKTI